MNKLFTKIATLSVGLAMAIGVGVAVVNNGKNIKAVAADSATVSISERASTLGWQNSQAYTEWTDTSGTFTFNANGGGNNGKWYTSSGGSWRMYSGGTLVISCSDSYTITSVTSSPTASFTIATDKHSASFSPSARTDFTAFTIEYSSGGVAPELTSISVSGEQTVYTVGDDFVKPTVTAHYDDESSADVTSDATFTGYDLDNAGNYTVTVSYGGQTTTYDITVNSEGETLYSADFRTVTAYGYTKNKEFTINDKGWLASSSQVASDVFYLGTNTTAGNVPYGILNDNESFADVVTALSSADSTYSSNVTTAHAYALSFDNAFECVGSVQLKWVGTNNIFQVYLFGDHGTGLTLLKHVETENGAAIAGSLKWTAEGYGEDFTRFVIVARPGASASTATSKTIRLSTFRIVEGESASLIDTAIYDSLKGEGPFEVVIGNTLSLFYYDLSVDNYIEDATWVSSDPTVFDASGQTSDNWYFHGKGLKEGQVTMTASKSGYKVAQAIVNVVPDPTLPEMEVWDTSSKVNDNASYYYSSTADIYKFTARKVGDSTIYVDDAVWESSDTTVATVTSSAGQCSLTTLKPGELDLTATSSSYQSVTVHIEIIKGSLEELNYDGNPSKTEYSDTDSWSADGVTITATYHSGWTEDVTSQVEWSFNPANPALGVESVVFTASFGGETVTTAPWAVTVVHHHAGTAEDPFTVAEALAKAAEIGAVGSTGQGPWVTKGIISRVTSAPTASYWNATYYISDDGSQTNELQVYRGFYIDNVKFNEETAALLVPGKVATVTGNLTGSYGSEYCQGNYLLALEEQSHGDIDVTFDPPLSLEVGATGALSASTTASNPVYTYSVDDSSLFSLDSSTGEYEVLGVGVVEVTVNITSDDGNGEAHAFITLNDNISNLKDVDDAIEIANSLGSGETTPYYMYFQGYVSQFDADGESRAIAITKLNESSSIIVFVGKANYASFIADLSLGLAVRIKANVQNFGGTPELQNPEVVYTEYVAMTFAFEFITETDAICKDYDGVKDNKEALEAIWTNLETKYDSLTDLQKSILVDPNMYGAGDTIKNAMARYDYVVGKYSLDNFISGRTPVAFANQPIQPSNNSVNTNFALVSVIIVAVVSVSAIGVLLVVKKRKYHN